MTTLSDLRSDPLGPRATGISEEDFDAMAREEIGRVTSNVRATRGKAVVWVGPYRKEGVIDTPWDFRGNSVEAVIVHDNTGAELPKGARVMIRPDEGILHTVDGTELCFIAKEALILLQT